MNNYPIKGFIERAKGEFKRVTGKITGGETSPAPQNDVRENDVAVQTDRDELQDGVTDPALTKR